MKKLITLSLITGSILFAAAPNIGDVVRETVPPKSVAPKTVPLIDISGIKKYAPAMKDDKSGKTIFVKSFIITGAISMDEKKLKSLIASYENKDLTFGQLQEVASVITKEYRDNGYFVAKAYIPVQSMKNGIVEIAIVEGKYGSFKLNNTSLVKDSMVQAMFDNIKDSEVIKTDSLERVMLIVNDTPGVKVSAVNIMSGSEVGTTDFSVTTEATPFYDGYILADNYGSRYTGENRVMAGVNFNSIAGIGDRLSVSGIVSNGADLKNARIAYSVPLMSNGLKAEVSYSATEYSLVEEYASLNADGEARTLDATFSYPIIRTRAQTLIVSSTISSIKLHDSQSSVTISDKDINSLNLGLDYKKNQNIFGLNGQLSSGVTFTAGDLTINDSASKISDKAGANTQGRYNKIDGYLGATVLLNNDVSLSTNLKFQKALGKKNLDGSEDFSVGGDNGVKVYSYSELSAEDGIMLNTELFYSLPSVANITHKLGIFYDIGRATMADTSNNTTFVSRTLQDIGIGYYASYEGFFAKAQVAKIVGGEKVLSEPDYGTKFLLQAGWSF